MTTTVGSHFIGGFDGTTVTDEVRSLIKDYGIGGFVIFSRNIESLQQISELIKEIQSLSKTPLFIGVDQEGGRVARLKDPFLKIPPMEKVGDYYRKTKDTQLIKQLGYALGFQLKNLGFNWDFAPCLDVKSNPYNTVIGDRSFAPDPYYVVDCGQAIIEGLHKAGVLSCVKHFPGHGATLEDSHFELPVVTQTGRLIWKRDVYPFRRLIARKKVSTLMTAHVFYPDIDPENCATLSYEIITNILRKRLKFENIVVSDDMFMKAIADNHGIENACLKFFKAGGDVTLVCHQPEVQMKAIEYVEEHLKDNPLINKSKKRILRIQKKFLLKDFKLENLAETNHQNIVDKILENAA